MGIIGTIERIDNWKSQLLEAGYSEIPPEEPDNYPQYKRGNKIVVFKMVNITFGETTSLDLSTFGYIRKYQYKYVETNKVNEAIKDYIELSKREKFSKFYSNY